MRCPFCAHEDSQVKDSRPSEDGASIRRRRECAGCGARFTTFERVQLRDLTVLKKDGKREPFDRAKVVEGVRAAAKYRPDRPIVALCHDPAVANQLTLEWGVVVLPMALAESVEELVEELSPVAGRLGCADELAVNLEILERGPSYMRQRRVVASGGTLLDVVDMLVNELETDRPSPTPHGIVT